MRHVPPGERVIPGEVEPDVWDEHISRYYFAAQFAAGKTVLDAGCGGGDGAAVLAGQAARVTGFDSSPEAVAYARARYPAIQFLVASAAAFPAADASVDLVTAFEFPERQADYRSLAEDANRVLRDGGMFLASEVRAEARRNPSPGFERALTNVFPFVRILAQIQQQCIVFAGEQASSFGLSFTASPPDLAQAQGVVAVCAKRPVEIPSFTYAPTAGNLLREHDREIDELRTDLLLTRAEATVARADLAVARAELERLLGERELAASSRWLRLGRKFHLGPDLTTSLS